MRTTVGLMNSSDDVGKKIAIGISFHPDVPKLTDDSRSRRYAEPTNCSIDTVSSFTSNSSVRLGGVLLHYRCVFRSTKLFVPPKTLVSFRFFLSRLLGISNVYVPQIRCEFRDIVDAKKKCNACENRKHRYFDDAHRAVIVIHT